MGRPPLVSSNAREILVENDDAEHPNVRAFPIHPGSILTDIARGSGFPAELFPDKLELASALILHLAAGKADWLSGRCVPSYSYLWVLEIPADAYEKICVCLLGYHGAGERLEREGVEETGSGE